jgi:AraC-like DNA-binding protein
MTYLTRSAVLLRYREHAIGNGLDPEAMLARCGIPEQYLAQRDLFFSYEKFMRLLDASAAESGNPCFGAELGQLQGIEVLGPIAYLVRSSATVGDALQNLVRYFHLQTTGARIRVEVHGQTALLAYDILVRTQVAARQAVELAGSIGVRMMRLFLAERWEAREAVFQHQRLGDARRYRQIYGVTPRFNGEYNGVTFDPRLLASPISDADPALHELMASQVDAMSAAFRDELPARVQALIRSELPAGGLSVDDIASRLALSSRSLQRYLREEGTSYQELLDGVRRDVAEHYLRDSGLQLTQVAQLLAYRELSNFTRAFQRWHGVSPREWRRQHAQPAARSLPRRAMSPTVRAERPILQGAARNAGAKSQIMGA